MRKITKEHNIEYLKIAFFITIVVLVVIGYLLSFIPDELDYKMIEETYTIDNVPHFVSEKSEFIQYVVLTVSFPILFILFYKLLSKVKPKINDKVSKVADGISVMLVFVLTAVVLIKNPVYVQRTVVSQNLVLTCLLLVIFSGLIVLYKKSYTDEKFKKLKPVLDCICMVLIIILIGVTGYLYINNSYAQTWYDTHHAEAYFYPIYKTNCGLTPSVDFNSIYGYYIYFFSFIMRTFWN